MMEKSQGAVEVEELGDLIVGRRGVLRCIGAIAEL